MLRESQASRQRKKVDYSMDSPNEFSIMGDTSDARSGRAYTTQSGRPYNNNQFSKKTLINDLKIITKNRIEREHSRYSQSSQKSR